MVPRSISADRFALFADGEALGFVKSVSGGNIKGEVATHNMGPDNFARKRLVGIRYEDITVETGMGMRKGWYDWIRQSFATSHIAKSGEIVAADFDYRAERAIIFDDALITECTFPALDGSSKDPAYMTIRLHPERLRHEQRAGERLNANTGIKTKRWLSSNFRFELGDLPCERVAKIDSFTLKQVVVQDAGGDRFEPTKRATKVEVPNLKITFSAADAGPWKDWFQSFVIDGKCSDTDELSGQIRFLGPDLKEDLAKIELSHVGIFGLRTARNEASREEVAAIEADLYVEEMKLSFNMLDA